MERVIFAYRFQPRGKNWVQTPRIAQRLALLEGLLCSFSDTGELQGRGDSDQRSLQWVTLFSGNQRHSPLLG